MTPQSEIDVIEAKLEELAGFVEKREQIQSRITKTEAAIRAFIELLDSEPAQQIYSARLDDISKPLGITEAIKRVLRNTRDSLNAVAVRDRLVASGFSISGYASPLAVIHTTLNRLNEQGLIEKVGDGFRWIETMGERMARIAREHGGSTPEKKYKYGKKIKRSHPRGFSISPLPNPLGHNLAEMLKKNESGDK